MFLETCYINQRLLVFIGHSSALALSATALSQSSRKLCCSQVDQNSTEEFDPQLDWKKNSPAGFEPGSSEVKQQQHNHKSRSHTKGRAPVPIFGSKLKSFVGRKNFRSRLRNKPADAENAASDDVSVFGRGSGRVGGA